MGNLGSFSNKDHSFIMNKREYDKYTKYTYLYDIHLRALDLEKYWSNWLRQIYLMESLIHFLLDYTFSYLEYAIGLDT